MIEERKYQGLILDLVGVLTADGTTIFMSELHRSGVSLEALEILKKKRREATLNEATLEDVLNAWQKEISTIYDTKKLAQQWLASYLPNGSVIDIIQRVRQGTHARLALITNNVSSVVSHVDTMLKEQGYPCLNEQFDAIVTSYGSHARKPDEQIYFEAMESLKVPAEVTVFIDDKSDNLEPAKQLGMTCLLYVNPPKLEADLRGLHLQFPPRGVITPQP